MVPLEWSLYADEEWHNGSGSLSYTFNEYGYYSATAKIDDKGNKAEDGWSTTNASVDVMPVDYIVVLPNPGVCAPGEDITFTGHAYNYGEDGLRYYDEYGQPIPDRADDDIKLGAVYEWTVGYGEEFGTVNPSSNSASTTFTAAETAQGTCWISATYIKMGVGNYVTGSADIAVNNWDISLGFGDGNEIPNIPFGTPNDDTVECTITVTDGPPDDDDFWIELHKTYLGEGRINMPTTVRVSLNGNGEGSATFDITSTAKSEVLDDILIEAKVNNGLFTITYDSIYICVFTITKTEHRQTTPSRYSTGPGVGYSEGYDHHFGGLWYCPGLATAGGGWDDVDGSFLLGQTEAETPDNGVSGGMAYDPIHADMGFCNSGTKIVLDTSPQNAFEGTVEVAMNITMENVTAYAVIGKPENSTGSGSLSFSLSFYIGFGLSYSWSCNSGGTCHARIKFGTEEPKGQNWEFLSTMILFEDDYETFLEHDDVTYQSGSGEISLPKEYLLKLELQSAADRNDIRFSAEAITKCWDVMVEWDDNYPDILTHY